MRSFTNQQSAADGRNDTVERFLCEPLGRNVLVSAELAAAVGHDRRLVPLGRYALRGVREARAIYGLEYGQWPAIGSGTGNARGIRYFLERSKSHLSTHHAL